MIMEMSTGLRTPRKILTRNGDLKKIWFAFNQMRTAASDP